MPDAASALVARHAAILGHPPLIALYSATTDEAPTAALAARLAADGLALALPVIGARSAPLTFRRWHPGDPLHAGPFGILQPTEGAIAEPDVLFVPLVAFDAAGHRLGYGGGYYDRTLAALRTKKPLLTVGLAFAAQQVATVPHEPHDIALDAVLTECGLVVDRHHKAFSKQD